MPIDPVKIPQNVHIEDRIVGPLTLKQIITVAIGCGFSYALYSMLIKSVGALPLPVTVMVWIPGALSFAFAFIKINDLSIFRILLLAVERINKPAVRTWSPRRGLSVNIRTANAPQEDRRVDTTPKGTDALEELSSILDLSTTSLIPSQAGGEKTPLSPLEELPAPSEQRTALPVDRSRVQASEPVHPTVSIFRDISPKH